MINEKSVAIEVFPNGYSKEEEGFLSIFLRNMAGENITVGAEFAVGKAKCQFKKVTILTNGVDCGWKNFLDVTNVQLNDGDLKVVAKRAKCSTSHLRADKEKTKTSSGARYYVSYIK